MELFGFFNKKDNHKSKEIKLTSKKTNAQQRLQVMASSVLFRKFSEFSKISLYLLWLGNGLRHYL